jgi:cardiolipin synthase
MIAIGLLLFSDTQIQGLPLREIGEIGLWMAAGLTIITGYDYFRASFAFFETDATRRTRRNRNEDAD